MSIRKILIINILSLFPIVCFAQIRVQVSGVLPPLYTFDPPLQKVIILNHYVPLEGLEELNENRIRNAEVFASASNIACYSVLNILKEQKLVTGVFLDTLFRAAKINNTLNKNQLISLAQKYQAQAVVILDALDIQVENEIVRIVDNFDTLQVIKTMNTYATTKTNWYLWDAVSGELLDSKELIDKDLHTYREVQSGLIAKIIGPDIPAARKTIEVQAVKQGRNFASRFTSTIYYTSREIFKDKPFKNVIKKIRNRQYQEAIQDLGSFLQSNDSQIVAKAYYNIAVCYEALRNTKEAYSNILKAAQFNKEESFAFMETHQQQIHQYMGELKDLLPR